MKNDKRKNKIVTSTASEILNLDPETKGKLQTISIQLDRTPTEVIEEFVYSIDRLFSRNRIDGNNTTREDLAFTFDFVVQHLHLLPQIAESVSLLSGRDTDIVISNLDISLETKTVTFDLGLGFNDLEKVFVTIEEENIQLFSNRYLSDKYIAGEVEQIKEYAYMVTKESVPYAGVIIGVVKSNSDAIKRADSSNKADGLAAGKMVDVEEVELTIRSHDIKYLPTFHKFNELMSDVIYYFSNHLKKRGE